jgi:hypothetical protein
MTLPAVVFFSFLENARISAAVHQHVLAIDVARMLAAQERAGGAELVRVAEAAGGGFCHTLHADFFRCFSGQFGGADEAAAQAVGFEAAGQQVVDRHAALGDVARDAGDETGQAGAGTVGQAEVVAWGLDRAAGDVDDAAPAALDHLVDGGLDQFNRREHVCVDGLEPDLAIPVAEVAQRWTAGGVDEDVGAVAGLSCNFVDGGQRLGATFRRGDVGGDRDHLDVAERAQLVGGLVERVLAAGDDDDVGAFARQVFGAGVAEAFAGAADEGDFSLKS